MPSHDFVPYRLVKPGEGRVPQGSAHPFVADASTTGGRFDLMIGTFAPMTGPPLHLHHEQDDTFYVLEGTLTVQVGEEVFDIGPGDFLSVPPETPHTFDNLHNGDRPVRAINLMTPGGFFDMLDAWGRIGDGPDHDAAMREAAERHGTVLMGPPLRVRLGLE